MNEWAIGTIVVLLLVVAIGVIVRREVRADRRFRADMATIRERLNRWRDDDDEAP